MQTIAVSRTVTSEPLSLENSLSLMLSSIVELPFSIGAVLWREDMPNAESIIADWCIANGDRVYIRSNDSAVWVVRRSNHSDVIVFRRDSWRSA